jgi:hypothetical protein
MTHNTRHQRAQDSQRLFASVPSVRDPVIEDQEGFPSKSAEGGGLKNRRLAECKMLIGQVLISRTLTDCGEVAERLKAAVC